MIYRFLGLRPEDRVIATLGFVVLGIVMAGHAMLETARDTLFLSELTPHQLPVCYLAIALLAVIAARANAILIERVDRRRLLALTLVLASVVTSVLWWLADGGSQTSLYAVYVWSGLVATVTVVQVWLIVGDTVDVAQAKRVFTVVGAGGVVGATLGSVAAERLVANGPTHHLVIAAALAFVVAAATSMGLPKSPALGTPVVTEGDTTGGVALLRSQPYLRRLLLLGLVGTIALTASDYVFKSIVAAEIPAAEMPVFFARFYLLLNALALVVQVGLSGVLLRALGVNRALLVLPALLAFGVAGIGAGSAFAAVLLLKGADGTLRHSLHRTASEVLYLPLPARVRERFKAVIDALGQRGGQAVASIAILAAIAIGATIEEIAMAIGLLIVAWLALLLEIKGHYLELFRGNLREGTIETRVTLGELDLHSLEALVGALSSDEDSEVLAALDLFERHDKGKLVPALLLYHPSRAIVLRTLDLFSSSGRRDHEAVVRRLVRSESNELRAAAFRALSSLGTDTETIRTGLSDPDPLVHATALVGLIEASGHADDELIDDLAEHVRTDGPDVHAALASAIRYQRDARFAATLVDLAAGSSPEVRREVALAMAVIPDARYLPRLLSMLGSGALRPVARRAILAIGDPALAFLDQALGDQSVPRRLRRHIPRTVSRFPAREAAKVLMRHLTTVEDGVVHFKILRGLGRLRAENRALTLDARKLRDLLRATLHRATQLLDWRIVVSSAQRADPRYKTTGGELLVGILEEKEANAVERVFRVLGLAMPGEDFELLYQGLRRRDKAASALSREILSNVLDGNVRASVLALVADAPDSERLAAAEAATGYSATTPTYDDVLLAMLGDSSEAVQSIAAYHVAELGLTHLGPELERLRKQGEGRHSAEGFLAEVVTRSLRTLKGAEEKEGTHAA